MIRKICRRDYASDQFSISIYGLRDFIIEYYYNGIYWRCNGNSKYLKNLVESIFGSNQGSRYCSAFEARSMMDTFVSAVEALNASMQEEEELKKEKARERARQYYYEKLAKSGKTPTRKRVSKPTSS